ncbi:MAG: hypothetical protein ACR2MC_09120 [Actinomycetota bacterium]
MYEHDPLEPGERVLFEQTASIPPWTGGQIIVTSTNLRFGPLSTRIPRTLLRLGGKVAGVSAIGTALDIIESLKIMKPKAVPLDQVTSIESLGGPSLFRPPMIRLTFRDGSSLDFGILRSVFSLNISKENIRVRDEFVDRVRRLLAS